MQKISARAEIITRRTYNRPLNDEGTVFESWEETVGRVIRHQEWLWARAQGNKLCVQQLQELEEFRQLMLDRKALCSGRTLWLGGTEVSRTREASMFNCSFLRIQTVYDCVDALWLLLNGCGVGFSPSIGTLNGFSTVIPEIVFDRSKRDSDYRGREDNEESFEEGVWRISIGDSAEAWAKALGKLLAGKRRAKQLVIDTTEVRGGGARLKGYGWISSGDAPLVKAIESICGLLNKRAGALLTRIDILDLVNHLGTILSTRRSAEICLFSVDEPEWREFAVAKKDRWEKGNGHREQSNNSLLFNSVPTRAQLDSIFHLMAEAGGSEPGFINATAARKRAPWFYGVNPCAEILLGDKSFCNLTEVDIGKFIGDSAGLERALYLASRANYRQTCVNLKDGILQEAWHLNNEFLRLCGVGHTGICKRDDLTDYELNHMQRIATSAAFSMADELKLPYPKNVTTVKPSGTLSKIMDTTCGVHKPLAKYIFETINFGIHDPLLAPLKEAGYDVRPHPDNPEAMLVVFPVAYEDVEFETVNGVEVNLESAIKQLERYKRYQKNWNQQNTSCTISYDPEEVPAIIDWLLTNWDNYVGVSFIYRTDPTKTACDLGYSYLPQQPVDRGTYEEYCRRIREVDIDGYNSFDEIETAEECIDGVCPIK
ncbi:MAG: ribonucleoside-triphosphate reductase, adenosylcobalamin-dependent [Colwellia sp.]|nr:ribonucleoside-triphosphate reductase, adenosylcobalamin-dependent [Colwellia sp.]